MLISRYPGTLVTSDLMMVPLALLALKMLMKYGAELRLYVMGTKEAKMVQSFLVML